MKRLLLVLVIAAIVAAAGWSMFGGRSAPSPVDPDLARLYGGVIGNLNSAKPQPDPAIADLEAARRKDPGNAMTCYLLAAAYAQKADWAAVAREVQEGNEAPNSLYYSPDEGAGPDVAGYATVRNLVLISVDAAPGLPPGNALALMRGLHTMSGKVAETEPRGFIPVLAGCALRAKIAPALVAAAERSGNSADVDAARRLDTADKEWVDKTRATIKAAVAKTDMGAIVQKHFTQEEWNGLDGGKRITPETRPKYEALRADIDAVERPVADKALESMPR